jgi:hypothetical protein
MVAHPTSRRGVDPLDGVAEGRPRHEVEGQRHRRKPRLVVHGERRGACVTAAANPRRFDRTKTSAGRRVLPEARRDLRTTWYWLSGV